MKTKKATLCVQGLTKSFPHGKNGAQQEISVLTGITAHFEAGKTYAISGISGSGKSTFMHLLAGLDTPTQGSVYFNNQDISTFTAKERANFLNQQIGIVHQLPYLIRELPVIENCMMRGIIAGMPRAAAINQAKELLIAVGLEDKVDCKPAALSGGQQQRLALARAMFNQPLFLLADEPTGNLDEKTGKEIINLLLDCHKKFGMGIIVSSHDPKVIGCMEISYQLSDGQLHFDNEGSQKG